MSELADMSVDPNVYAKIPVPNMKPGTPGKPVKSGVSVYVVYTERDPRAMNRMDPDTKLVHAYLEQWGRETKDRAENGFPASTLLGRMIEQGPMGASQSGRPPTDLTAQSALIDAAVSRLWNIGKRCVKRYYQTWEPMDVMARKEGISESHMKEVLRRSRHLIALWLDDAKKFEASFK